LKYSALSENVNERVEYSGISRILNVIAIIVGRRIYVRKGIP
jgi:hypothetical protein